VSYNSIIEKVEVHDIRVPTSDELLGSDPFHFKPNWSAVYTILYSSSGSKGLSIVFTCGAGNDWVAYGIKQLALLVKSYSMNDFASNPGSLFRKILDHHQLRWLGDGIFRMALGGIMNALWDLWAKEEKKPLWKLLADLPPEKIIDSIDWRYLKDAIIPEEAMEILIGNGNNKKTKENEIVQKGIKAYTTVGWSGLDHEQILKKIHDLTEKGFEAFKIKVGLNLEFDKERLKVIRDTFGGDIKLMIDANQVWGVKEAIDYVLQLSSFNIKWIEEPTARDDVEGHLVISKSLNRHGIGVAAGEQVPSPSLFKQMLTRGALQYCQVDASRMGGINDVFAIIIMAEKYNVPVCPHAGGIGLCNMVIHFSIWDQICVSGHSSTQLVEYVDFLQEGVFENPVIIDNGHYVVPNNRGWGLEMDKDFVRRHIYPTGKVWKNRVEKGGVSFFA